MNIFKRVASWFKNLFRKPQGGGLVTLPEPIKPPEPVKPPEPMPLPTGDINNDYKIKIALVIGHNIDSYGTSIYKPNSTGIYKEYEFNKFIAPLIKGTLIKRGYPAHLVKIFDKNEYRSSSNIAKDVAEWGADISMELHLNGVKYQAFGCEVLLCKGEDDTLPLTFIDFFSNRMGINKRHRDGIKWVGKKAFRSADRGWYNLKYMNDYGVPCAMLIEPTFVYVKSSEAVKVIDEYGNYVEAVADALLHSINN